MKHPIGRFGRVEEVADACVLLCADEAGFMTGANIYRRRLQQGLT